jgi:hypothetical protein
MVLEQKAAATYSFVVLLSQLFVSLNGPALVKQPGLREARNGNAFGNEMLQTICLVCYFFYIV